MESAFSGKKFTANKLLPHALRIVARELPLAQNAAALSCSPSLDLLKLAFFACFCPALPCAGIPISFHPPLSILCLSTKISCADWYLQNALCQARSGGAPVKAPFALSLAFVRFSLSYSRHPHFRHFLKFLLPDFIADERGFRLVDFGWSTGIGASTASSGSGC